MDGADPGVLVRRSWAEKVDAATDSSAKSAAADNVESSRASLFYDIRPALLRSSWTRNNAGTYYATAVFINQAGRADTSFEFTVYAPTALATPRGSANSWRMFVIWRGRWETLQEDAQAQTVYAGGYSIDISRVDNQTGARLVDNTGTRGVAVYTGTGNLNNYVDSGFLYLDARYFNLSGRVPDSAGTKYGVGLKTKYVTVTTPTGDEQICVIDA